MLERSSERASELREYGKPKKWYYALPAIALWALAAYLITAAIACAGAADKQFLSNIGIA